MRPPNYSANKKRREEANRKKQEEKRNRRLNKSKNQQTETGSQPGSLPAQT